MEATIYEKAAKAIEIFPDRKGYDIIERGWALGSDRAGFIAREDGDLVFVTAKVSEGSGASPRRTRPTAKASSAWRPPTSSTSARATSRSGSTS